jgi:DNA-binding HxlR family transcriptional regulator
MKGYGQFCPLALASEIVGERWTPLVLREIMLGARRFNDIHRGVPRMSPALLSRRLRRLESAGIVERRRVAGRIEYQLTEAGKELRHAIESLARWGKRWLPATLSRERADPDLIMWDMRRRIEHSRMPDERTVIRFDFEDQPKAKRLRWLVGDREGVELCITDPGFEVDLFVSTDSRTITLVWYGDIPLRRALADGQIELHGPRDLCRAFPGWLQLNLLADIPRQLPVRAA